MAKSKNRNTTTDTSTFRPVRGAYVTARPRLYRSISISPSLGPNSSLFTPTYLLEDRRTFHFDDPYRLPKGVFRGDTRLRIPRSAAAKKAVGRSARLTYPSPNVVFARPDRVALCVKRKTRREVLLASGFGGRNRKGRRTYSSQFSCG